MRRALLLLLLLPASDPVAGAAPDPVAVPARGWLHLDAPLWDISHEGLAVRLTWSRAGGPDPVARMLGAGETRWTFGAGYVKVYNSYDATTGLFKNPGGHAALASVGRQWRWRAPAAAGPALPELSLELGAHAASRRFPADGTRANVKLIPGLEWRLRRGTPAEWSLGVMWLHFSNANLLSRNSGYDGLALRVGRPL